MPVWYGHVGAGAGYHESGQGSVGRHLKFESQGSPRRRKLRTLVTFTVIVEPSYLDRRGHALLGYIPAYISIVIRIFILYCLPYIKKGPLNLMPIGYACEGPVKREPFHR